MRVLVIGGGAAGMFFSILAAQGGAKVTLLEKNERLGKKLYITGKGRCNFTNACTPEEFRANVVTNRKFLFSASEALTSGDVIDLFESWGLRTKVERGRRAFPASDHSADVIDMLVHRMRKNHVEVRLGTEVTRLITEEADPADGKICVKGAEIRCRGSRERLFADAVVLATGGMSYPSTGSTGDGYRFAGDLGLAVTQLYPSLVPFNCREEYVKNLQGLSLKNVKLSIRNGKKLLFEEFGELLFTHFGISGPLTLSASALTGPLVGKEHLSCSIDLKPAVTNEQLSDRFLRVFSENPKKELKNVMHLFYPSKMTPVIPALAETDEEKQCGSISREERERLVRVTKQFPLTLRSLRGMNEAVVTKGGIDVREVDPRSMAAKKVRGLYCIGELLDVDAFTGGYNLQIAWCTAAACARAITGKEHI